MKVAEIISKKEITIQTVEQPSGVLGQKQIEQKMAEARPMKLGVAIVS